MTDLGCRSVSPDFGPGTVGLGCQKAKGHNGKHSHRTARHMWTGGIKTPARWVPPPRPRRRSPILGF